MVCRKNNGISLLLHMYYKMLLCYIPKSIAFTLPKVMEYLSYWTFIENDIWWNSKSIRFTLPKNNGISLMLSIYWKMIFYYFAKSIAFTLPKIMEYLWYWIFIESEILLNPQEYSLYFAKNSGISFILNIYWKVIFWWIPKSIRFTLPKNNGISLILNIYWEMIFC